MNEKVAVVGNKMLVAETGSNSENKRKGKVRRWKPPPSNG
jgi:hypothetical protein